MFYEPVFLRGEVCFFLVLLLFTRCHLSSFHGVVGHAGGVQPLPALQNASVTSGQKRSQIEYFFLATAIGYAGGSLDYLPIFGFDLYPYGNFAIVLYRDDHDLRDRPVPADGYCGGRQQRTRLWVNAMF